MPVLLKIKKMGHHHHGSKLRGTITMEVEDDDQFAISLLDLPDLALESILERLALSELCRMATVCKSLRESCASDHLWKKHLELKWARVIDAAAFREWQWHMASLRKRSRVLDQENEKSLLRSDIGSSLWPFSWSKTNFESKGQGKPVASSFTADSTMDLYLSLENGKFSFPAQVYNRECQDERDGFLLSCYDAELSYDSQTDTFQARYPPFAQQAAEQNINWDRLRAPPIDTPASVLHVSDCLNDLKPDDHIEIQWRKSNVFPYGWWYGVVCHLESCHTNHCCCQSNAMVVLDFKQYTPGSQWRRAIINRKDHREEGNEADGFYGGIRKLYSEKEISRWKQLWPRHQLE